jgi:divinyl protochlorophyllide a 8-vinyl-reductase
MNSSAASPSLDAVGETASTVDITSGPGKIGPNAILQVQDVLTNTVGNAQMHSIMHQAGLGHYLGVAPSSMVDEQDVVRLHQAVRTALPPTQALGILSKAGTQTGQYILAHRIPKPVQALLTWMPARLASRVLLRAIAQHAWTFAGSGAFTYSIGPSTHLKLTACPGCSYVYAPDEACVYYTATLEKLFAALVHPNSKITEALPASADGSVRTMRLSWRSPQPTSSS